MEVRKNTFLNGILQFRFFTINTLVLCRFEGKVYEKSILSEVKLF